MKPSLICMKMDLQVKHIFIRMVLHKVLTQRQTRLANFLYYTQWKETHSLLIIYKMVHLIFESCYFRDTYFPGQFNFVIFFLNRKINVWRKFHEIRYTLCERYSPSINCSCYEKSKSIKSFHSEAGFTAAAICTGFYKQVTIGVGTFYINCNLK